ncbi:hypothetical protein BDV10DRAFT_185122 [Aspergillus recurvatus]
MCRWFGSLCAGVQPMCRRSSKSSPGPNPGISAPQMAVNGKTSSQLSVLPRKWRFPSEYGMSKGWHHGISLARYSLEAAHVPYNIVPIPDNDYRKRKKWNSILDRSVKIHPLLPDLLLLHRWNHPIHPPIVRGVLVNIIFHIIFPLDPLRSQDRLHNPIDIIDESQPDPVAGKRASRVIKDEDGIGGVLAPL